MDFKLFRHHSNRTSILVAIILILAVIVGVAIVGGTGSFDTTDSRAKALSRIILFIIDGLLIGFVLWGLHMMQSFVSAAYEVTSKTYITKETKTKVSKFTNPWWLHFWTMVFLIAIYFLSITGVMYGFDLNNESWVTSAKANWWICLIAFFINLGVSELTFNLNLYKFNHDEKILAYL